MPSNVHELMEPLSLKNYYRVAWGQMVSQDKPGVYIVSVENILDYTLVGTPINRTAIKAWLKLVPMLTMDGVRPEPNKLANRISKYWLFDETVIYIGKAGTSLKKRIGQYYRTRLGSSGPHAGGHWIKTLAILNHLSVYYALVDNPERAEQEMLYMFSSRVSDDTRTRLNTEEIIIPFANLEIRVNNSLYRKRHGLAQQVLRSR